MIAPNSNDSHGARRKPRVQALRTRTRDSRLTRLSRDWSTLGKEDPLWAVCVDPARRGGRWDLAEFLASGRAEISAAIARLDELAICPRRGDALDFGCGVGRLTAALGDHFGSVTGVDISRPMLDQARELHAGRARCTFVHNDSADLRAFADGSFDLVYSSLVLQHMPGDLAAGYLLEFLRVLRPGGAAVILVPEAHLRTPRGLAYAYAPRALIGLIQRRIFGFPAAMQMHTLPARRVRELVEPAGGRLVVSDPQSGFGDHWQMTTHFIAGIAARQQPDLGTVDR
jgi:ubiquinone/menaquinone biosynthesis C-methylase UbiE